MANTMSMVEEEVVVDNVNCVRTIYSISRMTKSIFKII